MSTPPDMAERHARVLARLTEMGLALAEQAFEDAQAAETPQARVEQVKAFHTISRSVRQTVALEARLARQQTLDVREAERVAAALPPRKPSGVERLRRINTVHDAMTRIIWHEAEDDDSAAWLQEDLDAELASACQRDDVCAEPLDDHIARLCLEMGLPEEAALSWRDLPEPGGPPESDDPPVSEDPEGGPQDEADAIVPPDPGGFEPQALSSA